MTAAGITGIVLAAGAGRRYGGPKVLAEGGRWLTLAVDALRDGGCDDVVVVLGAVLVEVPAGSRAVVNPLWETGMGESLRVGLSASGSAGWAVIVPIDTPDVGGDVVARVLSAAEPTGVARATYAGVPGHPVVLAHRWWDAAHDAATGDEGARKLLQRNPHVVEVPCEDLATGRDHDEM